MTMVYLALSFYILTYFYIFLGFRRPAMKVFSQSYICQYGGVWGKGGVGGQGVDTIFVIVLFLALRQKMFRCFFFDKFCNFQSLPLSYSQIMQSLTLQLSIFASISSSIIPFKDAGMYFCQVKPIVNSKAFNMVTKDVVR